MTRAQRFFCLLAAGLCLSQTASAQLAEDLIPTEQDFVSPEYFTLELRVGPYTPNNSAFDETFDDVGPLLELEIDVIAHRIPDLVYFGLGATIGFSAYSGNAVNLAGEETSEETTLDILPLGLLAVARFDGLARRYSVPVILTAKLGYSWLHWSTATGGHDEGDGWTQGIRYAGQIALDLDSLEPRAARALDEEWGINHSFLFFEYWGFEKVNDSMELGDTTWIAGLGFVF